MSDLGRMLNGGFLHFDDRNQTVSFRLIFSHFGRPGSTANKSLASCQFEISKDPDSDFFLRFAQILAPLARKYVLAVAISRASVANSRWARKFLEPSAVEQFVRKGL